MTSGAILMVDDDVELCALIAEYLAGHGFRVDGVYDGTAGLRAAVEGSHDLVILDVMLPGLDGFEVLRQLRKRSNVPVIMLTARVEEHDRVEGFRQGADDYLVKPFAAAELLGRVRAVLRRVSGAPAAVPQIVRVGALTLDVQAHEAYLNDQPLGLTSSEFSILELLTRAAGRVVSRDELSAVMYQRETAPFERSIDMHVSHLRKKLDAGGHSIIRTVRGVGYVCTVNS